MAAVAQYHCWGVASWRADKKIPHHADVWLFVRVAQASCACVSVSMERAGMGQVCTCDVSGRVPAGHTGGRAWRSRPPSMPRLQESFGRVADAAYDANLLCTAFRTLNATCMIGHC